MTATKILKLEVDWHHGYGNRPELVVHVDKRPKHEEFEYMAIRPKSQQPKGGKQRRSYYDVLSAAQALAVNVGLPTPPVEALAKERPLVTNVTSDESNQNWREEGNIFLLSVNKYPWIKFVSIADPWGSPSHHGNLGGEFKMVDGTTFKSRTGWSSSAGAVNRYYTEFIPNNSDIVDVILVEPREPDTRYQAKWAGYALAYTELDKLYDTDLWPTALDEKVQLVKIDDYWSPSMSWFEIAKAPKP